MRQFLKKRFKNERGLTLVELLAVIVILAIISIIAFVFIGGIIENSKKDAHIANAQQIIAAAKLHEASGGEIGTASTGDEAVTVDNLKKWDYLDRVINPWDKATDYGGAAYVTKVKEDDITQLKIHNFDVDGKCEITATENQLNTEDRDDLCKSESTGG